MKLMLSFFLCLIANSYCHAQLQIKPPKEDTMSNSSIAKWYADKYQTFLALSEVQKEQVYQILLANKNKLDSLNAKSNVTTEDLVNNYIYLDNNLKAVFTDKQYYDYLYTSNIGKVQIRK